MFGCQLNSGQPQDPHSLITSYDTRYKSVWYIIFALQISMGFNYIFIGQSPGGNHEHESLQY